MARASLIAARKRAFARLADDHPGTILFLDAATLGVSTYALACAIVLGQESRESSTEGFYRLRSATVYIAKSTLATLPSLDNRPRVRLTPESGSAEDFRVFEAHDQAGDHWLLKLGQFD